MVWTLETKHLHLRGNVCNAGFSTGGEGVTVLPGDT